jgi:hypothetical protein
MFISLSQGHTIIRLQGVDTFFLLSPIGHHMKKKLEFASSNLIQVSLNFCLAQLLSIVAKPNILDFSFFIILCSATVQVLISCIFSI